MRRLCVLSVYLVVVFIGAGLVSPWVWTAVRSLAAHGPSAGLSALAQHPFHRYVHRCLLVAAVIGLWPLARALGLRTREDLGLRVAGGPTAAARFAIGGLAASVGMFLLALTLELGSGTRHWRGGLETVAILRGLGQAVLAGVTVGVLEEIVFRGVLCGGLRDGTGWAIPIGASSLVFSFVHLFRRAGPPEVIGAGSGLETIGIMLGGLGDAGRWWPGGMTLVLAGVLLALWYRQTGNLYGSIGLHAGWVIGAKLRGLLTGDAGLAGTGAGFETQVWDHWVMLPVMAAGLAGLWVAGGGVLPWRDGKEPPLVSELTPADTVTDKTAQ